MTDRLTTSLEALTADTVDIGARAATPHDIAQRLHDTLATLTSRLCSPVPMQRGQLLDIVAACSEAASDIAYALTPEPAR